MKTKRLKTTTVVDIHDVHVQFTGEEVQNIVYNKDTGHLRLEDDDNFLAAIFAPGQWKHFIVKRED